MKFFKRLESKPSHIKAQYSFVVATVCTGVIALVWLTTLPAQFAVHEGGATPLEEVSGFKNALQKTTSQLGAVFKGIIQEEDDVENNVPPSEPSETGGVSIDEDSGIIMPQNVTPESVLDREPIEAPQETPPKEVLIETTKSEPERAILIGTSSSEEAQNPLEI